LKKIIQITINLLLAFSVIGFSQKQESIRLFSESSAMKINSRLLLAL